MPAYEATRSEADTLRDQRIAGAEGLHPLDSEENQNLLQELMRFRRQSRAAHSDNRREMAVDEDYYDTIQLTEHQLAILASREQDPRVWNVVKNVCNWLIGTERKMRVDYKVLPRKKEQAESAKAKTKAMKFITDDSRGEFCVSQAFSDAIKAGVGWLEEAARSDETKEPLFTRVEDWRNMWFDHLGRAIDCSDWRYVLREKWVDLDIAQSMFPDRADELEQLAQGVNSLYPYNPEDTILNDPATEFDMENDFDALTGGAYDGYRLRVKLIEMWYRKPAKCKQLRISHENPNMQYGVLDGAIYRDGDPVHEYAVRNDYATIIDVEKMTVRVAMWAGAIFLQESPTPYNHDRFPFVPIFCYRRKRDGMPYGIIRDIRSPQDSINTHKARVEFLMSSQKVIMEKGAVNDPATFYEEYSRADCIALVNEGKLERVKIIDGVTHIQGHVEEIADSQRFIQSISGVQDPMRGETEKDLSGKAIGLLQNQGMTTSGIPFDNLYEAYQLAGEIRLSNIEQFYNTEKTLRITGGQNKDDFVDINKYDPAQGRVINSITDAKCDFIVARQDYRETVRQAMQEKFGTMLTDLMKVGGKGAEAAFILLDIYLDMMDELADKDEAVKRIRKMNGQEGPDEEATPAEKSEREQRKQAMMAQQEEQQAMMKKMGELELALKEAEVEDKKGRALESNVKAMLGKMELMFKAIETALAVKISPDIIQAADHLNEEAQNLAGESPAGPEQQPPPQQAISIPPGGGAQ